MKDIITGLNGETITRRDLSSNWNRAFNLGRADAGEDFSINGYLGNTNAKQPPSPLRPPYQGGLGGCAGETNTVCVATIFYLDDRR